MPTRSPWGGQLPRVCRIPGKFKFSSLIPEPNEVVVPLPVNTAGMTAAAETDKMERVREKVEQMGVFFERSGLAPMTGRVFAYLLVCEPPHKDFFAIQEFLQASKSAVSNALSTLGSEGMVDYITFNGDRRRYFRINTNGWMTYLKNKLRRVTVLGDLLDDVLKERCHSSNPAFNNELNQVAVFQNYLARGIENLIDEWDKKQPAQ